MLNWFKKHKHSNYRKTLLHAFPSALRKEVEGVLDILPFDINEVKLSGGQIYKTENLIHPDLQTVFVEGEQLSIPCRIYFNEPELEKESTLTNVQKAILNCIYLRHHNGFVRQSRLDKIVSNEYWITPFYFQLLGEYVMEILDVLDQQLNNIKLENYKRFALENPKYYRQTESRMISYWNEYYRRNFPKLKLYVGKIILDQIKAKTIGKVQDEIIEIGIDENEQLFIKPKNEHFSLIYRTATEVHWDEKNLFLYSPKPREWSYYNWYKHITDVVNKEYNCQLILTQRTKWTNINNNLKELIIKQKNL